MFENHEQERARKPVKDAMRSALFDAMSRHKMRAWALLGLAGSLGVGVVAACGSDSGGGPEADAGSDGGPILTEPGVHVPVSIAAGGSHACVIMDDGRLLCWGRNEYGQLGNPQRTDLPDGGYTFDDRPVPAPLTASVANVVQVAPGGPEDEDGVKAQSTCAVLSDAQVQCWGEDRFGALGRADSDQSLPHPEPRPVSNLGPAQQVATNGMTSCATSGDGRTWCWGRNQYWADGGGGGLPTETDLSTHVDVKHLALGMDFGVALVEDQWGNRLIRGWGTGTWKLNDIINPVEVAAGGFTGCARTRNGDVVCFGRSLYGMLGRGPTDAYDSDDPALVLLPTKTAAATQIAMALNHVCALLNDGTVWCWGNNFWGGLGSGTSNGATVDPGESSTPLKVEGLPNPAIAIATGFEFTCALLSDHSVMCWGRNEEGTLGQGTIDTAPHITPVKVLL